MPFIFPVYFFVYTLFCWLSLPDLPDSLQINETPGGSIQKGRGGGNDGGDGGDGGSVVKRRTLARLANKFPQILVMDPSAVRNCFNLYFVQYCMYHTLIGVFTMYKKHFCMYVCLPLINAQRRFIHTCLTRVAAVEIRKLCTFAPAFFFARRHSPRPTAEQANACVR